MDRGLNLEKLRGSLAKVAARRGMFRSDPLNLDPAAQICWARDLIVTAGHRSDGSGRLGARAAALATGGEHLRWRAAALALDFTELYAPGLKSTRAWVRRVRRNTRNPPRVTAGLAEALGGERKGGGGSARHDLPACTFMQCSGLRDGGKRLWVRAQCKNNAQPGLCGAVLCRRGVTAVEQRRRNAGGGVPAAGMDYCLPELAQKD